MKTPFLSSLAAALLCASAHGQALLSFGGGNGLPLTLTISQPVTYTITLADPAGSSPLFVFDGLGFGFFSQFISGGIVFTVNGGPSQSISLIHSGQTGGAVTGDDAYMFGMLPGVTVGDTVTLGAGTSTIFGHYAGPPPPGGSFTTFIVNQTSFAQLSNPGTVVPEPGSFTLTAVAGLGLLVLARRRRYRRGL